MLVVKNESREGPGLLEQVLKAQQIEFVVVDLARGAGFPSPKGYQALCVLGGSSSANDQSQKMQAQLQRVNEALALGIPYLGICLGMQVLVKTGGGKVQAAKNREIGFFDPLGHPFSMQLTAAGKKDPLFQGLEESEPIFHLHGETVELGQNMALLATGAFCHHQAVKVGTNAYGIQGHLELTSEMLAVWLQEDPELRQLNGETVRSHFSSIEANYVSRGRHIFKNFLSLAGLIPSPSGARRSEL